MTCNNCKIKNECGYYEETIKPMQMALTEDDVMNGSFRHHIDKALEEFYCEYKENK